MKRIVQIIVAVLCLLLFLNLAKVITLNFWPDFSVYYHTADFAIHGNNPYVLKGIFVGGYLYPPISIVLFYPLLFFPAAIAGKIWAVISIICLMIAIWLLAKLHHAQKE